MKPNFIFVVIICYPVYRTQSVFPVNLLKVTTYTGLFLLNEILCCIIAPLSKNIDERRVL